MVRAQRETGILISRTGSCAQWLTAQGPGRWEPVARNRSLALGSEGSPSNSRTRRRVKDSGGATHRLEKRREQSGDMTRLGGFNGPSTASQVGIVSPRLRPMEPSGRHHPFSAASRPALPPSRGYGATSPGGVPRFAPLADAFKTAGCTRIQVRVSNCLESPTRFRIEKNRNERHPKPGSGLLHIRRNGQGRCDNE